MSIPTLIIMHYQFYCEYMYIRILNSLLIAYTYIIAVCPVKGQIRKECALQPGCHGTCDNPDVICIPICIENGCECPTGTIIDEAINECVAPSECTGIHNIIMLL